MNKVEKMIGIYKITNTATGQFYIGQSADIERRWMEHRTPKARGNDRLHTDIKLYGLEAFAFEVLEECEKENLLIKERHYIDNLNPFYNSVKRRRSAEFCKKVSEGTKRWWETLSEETKQKIIKNNLKGPKKGHTVSAETRAKISQKVSEIQKQPVRCIETGEIFESVGAFEKAVCAQSGTCAAYWRGKIKSVKGFHVEKCRD